MYNIICWIVIYEFIGAYAVILYADLQNLVWSSNYPFYIFLRLNIMTQPNTDYTGLDFKLNQ